jgi:crotonobetainyl-CoA:carnitine CoA-transferase CaiB-like acyl-CoA transferase
LPIVPDGALNGLLVVSVEQAVAAPLASYRLAEAGARVIKIERPEGDFARAYDRVVAGESTFFAWLNRGKESVALDFKQPRDADLLRALIAAADVFIQNLAPGAAARAGFDPAELRARHPPLITCDISGYGESGPYSAMKAYDLLIQAETGLASVTGAEDAPGRVGISICDIAAGTTAYAAILEALLKRARTGLGDGLAVSLFDVMAEWMSVPLLHHDYGAGAPARIGLRHPSIAPYGVYATDGPPILIAVQNEREWRRLCMDILAEPNLAERPEFADNVSRVANRALLDARIAARFLALPRDELIRRLGVAGIAYGAINGVAELSTHPALRRVSLAEAEGIAMIANPIRRASDPVGPPPGKAPALGEHTAAVRAEFAGR